MQHARYWVPTFYWIPSIDTQVEVIAASTVVEDRQQVHCAGQKQAQGDRADSRRVRHLSTRGVSKDTDDRSIFPVYADENVEGVRLVEDDDDEDGIPSTSTARAEYRHGVLQGC